MSGTRILIIGGGAVGLAAGYKIGCAIPSAQVTVLEKEGEVAHHQTGNNSGVLHCGLHYKPGSMKARMAVDGVHKMVAFCRENGVPHDVCGNLVVAVNESELPRLHSLLERGTLNGLKGLEVVGPERMREIEPHVGGVAGLKVPEEGIVDYRRVCEVLAEKIQAGGGRVVFNAKAKTFREHSGGWTVETPAGDFETELLVTCAGLHADRVAEQAGEHVDVRVVPFRGEYFKLRKDREYLVRNLIYPTPDPTFPFLGVHLTRMIRGGIEAGPNAVLAFAREGYKKTDINLRDLFDALTYKGMWNFLMKYPRVCWYELRRSFSKPLFCAALRRLVPELQESDLDTGGAGVRAQVMSREGDLVHDFQFIIRKRVVHVLNAPSPAATASLAIGEEIAAQVQKLL